MQLTVHNHLARVALQFVAYACFVLVAGNLVVQAIFNSKLNVVWVLASAALVTLVVKQRIATRIVITTLLALMGFAILALTATGDLFWTNWR